MDYVIVREIARGGMGSVFEALQCGVKGFSKRVALKVMHPDLSRRPELRELFVAEAHLAADLVHENIVQIYHLGEIPVDPDAEGTEGGAWPQLYFSMELIDGAGLDAVLARHAALGTRLPVGIAARIASRIGRALDYAHARTDFWGAPLGIVHRDVSPANALIARAGLVKLLDFGVAKARYRMGALSRSEEEGKVLFGRARYMSPEAARFEATDARSDIYSLGCVLFEMLVGSPAFRDHTRPEPNPRGHELPSLTLLRGDIPAGLEAIVSRALEPDPDRRDPSAGDLAGDLERAIHDSGAEATTQAIAAHFLGILPDPAQVDEARRGAKGQPGASPTEINTSVITDRREGEPAGRAGAGASQPESGAKA